MPFRIFEGGDQHGPEKLTVRSLADLAPGGLAEIDMICDAMARDGEILWDGPPLLPEDDA
ncbi:MAG: hypothetical protein M5R36_18380 [Deltaproteobacteria bacterium]|nr:hypothetical protein [Deltaproteobacteria bacterium]